MGNKQGFLEATVEAALRREDLRGEFLEYLVKVATKETEVIIKKLLRQRRNRMIEITVERFAKMYVENNPGEKFNEVKSNLKTALSRKKAGAVCVNCGQPIWAAGSAIVGFDGCFTCITGESDHSEDYEVYE